MHTVYTYRIYWICNFSVGLIFPPAYLTESTRRYFGIYCLLLLTCAVGPAVEAQFGNGAVRSLNVIRILITSLFLKYISGLHFVDLSVNPGLKSWLLTIYEYCDIAKEGNSIPGEELVILVVSKNWNVCKLKCLSTTLMSRDWVWL
jgi:hypothetical protein